MAPELSALLTDYVANCASRFLFETATGLPMAPRNIARDSLHPLLKKIGCGSAGFHTFRRFREAILQMSNARNLLIDFWMGHANSEMAGRYGKQLLANNSVEARVRRHRPWLHTSCELAGICDG